MTTLEISQIVFNKLHDIKHLEVEFSTKFRTYSNLDRIDVEISLYAYDNSVSGSLFFTPENTQETIELHTEGLYHRLFAKELLKFRKP